MLAREMDFVKRGQAAVENFLIEFRLEPDNMEVQLN
jgi:hypothetical protein